MNFRFIILLTGVALAAAGCVAPGYDDGRGGYYGNQGGYYGGGYNHGGKQGWGSQPRHDGQGQHRQEGQRDGQRDGRHRDDDGRRVWRE